jgi:Galactose oxidase, central domain
VRTALSLLAILLPSIARAAEPNTWAKLPDAQIEGRRWDVPLAYSPELKRFVVLGGRTSQADYKKPRSYDVLSLDPKSGKWRNELPTEGKDWGPEYGPVEAPGWKNETWGFTDAKGNTRPNWTVYGTFSLGGLFGHDDENGRLYFFAGRDTFHYLADSRQWFGARTHRGPGAEYPDRLLWSSMSYDSDAKRFVLFGGGNVPSERGDPGTWVLFPEGNRWEHLKPTVEPPARANSRLAYDPSNKRTVLFGGDQLDRLIADTWVYDSAQNTWSQSKPKMSPSPRGGHALLWLPKAKKILLLGGYTYTSTTDYVASLYKPLPFEAWTYDVAANTWELAGRWEKDAPVGSANTFLPAAVDEDDNVLVLDSQNRAWTCKFDVSKPDEAGTRKFGVASGAAVFRTGSHDPKWYTEGVAAPDAAAIAERLKKLPANEWVQIPTPNAPKMNMDWGSAVFDTANDKILRFSGGHSAYSGTAPFVYDVKTDRYSLPFAPEYPLEFVYSNDQVRGEWSFKGRPWMTGHTYKTTGYEVSLKAMIFVGHEHTFAFDAVAGEWSRLPESNPFRADFYTTTVCSTPQGAIVWAQHSLENRGPWVWRFNPETKGWKPLPIVIDPQLPAMSPDQHGLAFDAKRNRLLFFSDLGQKKGNVAAYDIKMFKLAWLDPAGADKALVPCRETVYLPEADMVLIGARVKDGDGKLRWLAFDCAANAWVSLALTGSDPIGKARAFNNSMGLMYDPGRKLIWAVGQHSEVYALRFDADKADKKPLR